MITENAAKLAEKEYRRRHPRMGFPWWALVFLVPFWLAVSVAAGAVIWLQLRNCWQTPRAYAFAIGLVTGSVLFAAFPMLPIYVFGHEMTHWLAAKATFHKTGKFQMGAAKGYMEIPEPTGFIALAPYFIPFYFLLLACVVAFLAVALSEAPEMLWLIAADCLGMTYAYHLVLSAKAIKRGQKDLEFCGKFLSGCIILAGNLVILAAAAWLFHQAAHQPIA